MDITILYYTSNSEDPVFEQKIIDNIKKQAGDIPIISVSHKPMDLGKNICIGEQEVSYLTEWKQILIGLKEAKTKFCIATESDCLYPPEYFTFIPPRDDMVYRYDNVWVYWKDKPAFYRKYRCEGAQMCGREYWIERLESALKYDNPRDIARKMFPTEGHWTGNPVVTFKTGRGVSGVTGYIKESKTQSIPYWNINKYI